MKKITSKKRQEMKRQNEHARKKGNQKYSRKKTGEMVENRRLDVPLNEERTNIPIMHKLLNIIGDRTLMEIAKKNPVIAGLVIVVITLVFWDLSKDILASLGKAGLATTGLILFLKIGK